MDSTLIVVVDMVNGFVHQGPLVADGAHQILAPIGRLLLSATDAECVFVCDQHTPDSIELQTWPPHCLVDSAESQVVPELAHLATTILPKNSTNAFWTLERAGLVTARDFVVVGLCTDICVMQLALTLRAWLDEGDRPGSVTVLEDCVWTFDAPGHPAQQSHRMALELMRGSGVRIATWHQA